MNLLDAPRALLAFLGRHGPAAFALSFFVGLALPWLAAPARPFFPVVIFCFVAMNMMRADLPALRRLAGQPGRVALALAINILLPFLLIGAGVVLVGRAAIEPALLLGLALAAAAPPLVAAPAYALLFGLSNALSLTILVLAMTMSPIVAPLIADTVAGAAVPIDPWALAGRLAIFLFGAMAFGLIVRRFVGLDWIAQRKEELDGAGVFLFFIFALTITEAVGRATLATPGLVAFYTLIVMAIWLVSFAIAYAAWRPFGAGDAITLALATSLRNAGLLVSVMGIDNVPFNAFVFFSLMQFPIYIAPQLIKPFVGRLLGADRAVAGPH